MKRIFSILAASVLCTSMMMAQSSIQQEVDQRLQNLPFPSFSIKVPTFPDKTYNIKDAGAVGNGITKCTEAINKTIERCSAAGGGTVVIPSGMWLTGPITMQSNVNLHLEYGAMVVFSADPADCPLVSNDGKKYRVQSLINGTNLKNIAITGHGIFNGNGSLWRPVKHEKLPEKQWKNMTKNDGELTTDGKMWYPVVGTDAAYNKKNSMDEKNMTKEDWESVRLTMRPYLLNIEKVDGMLVEGITLQNSPHITNMLRSINGLVMKDVTVLNEWWFQNADGLDISVCKNVLLYGCTVNTGDDGICMKSSSDKDVKDPFRLENIVIKDCKVYHAHGGFVIGSNTDGGMRNIYVQNCNYSWTDCGLRFKSDFGRGGKVQNIYMEDIYMKDIAGPAIDFELTYSDNAVGATGKESKEDKKKAPDFNGFYFKNIYCDGAKEAVNIGGTDKLNVKNVEMDNVNIQAKAGFSAYRAEGLKLSNVNIQSDLAPAFTLNRSQNVTFENVKGAPLKGSLVKVMGEDTKSISISNISMSQTEIINGADSKQVTFK
jgi:polygalacturonase